jgi:hypothetical protein
LTSLAGQRFGLRGQVLAPSTPSCVGLGSVSARASSALLRRGAMTGRWMAHRLGCGIKKWLGCVSVFLLARWLVNLLRRDGFVRLFSQISRWHLRSCITPYPLNCVVVPGWLASSLPVSSSFAASAYSECSQQPVRGSRLGTEDSRGATRTAAVHAGAEHVCTHLGGTLI